jgi:hypothetical protein
VLFASPQLSSFELQVLPDARIGPPLGALSVNDLPLELLADIFVPVAYAEDDGPWMASTVCKHWWRVVLHFPKAWSKTNFLLKNFPQPDPV